MLGIPTLKPDAGRIKALHGRQEGDWQLLCPLVSIMDVIMSVITIVSVLVKPWIDQVHA
jgi:hypothetical protein